MAQPLRSLGQPLHRPSRAVAWLSAQRLIMAQGAAYGRISPERSREENSMFVRNKQLQYPVRVDRPDPLFAKQVQELIGGVYGEFTVMA